MIRQIASTQSQPSARGVEFRSFKFFFVEKEEIPPFIVDLEKNEDVSFGWAFGLISTV